jgi:choline-sulfatase
MLGRGFKVIFSQIACGVALLGLAGCRSADAPSSSKPDAPVHLLPLNLVVVTIDTLRADRLHCYGNKNIETPTLDGLAQRGVLFENAVAQTPLTPPSHASIFTGTNPTVHHVRNTGGFALQPSSMTLAKIMKEQGRDTAAFVGASVLKKSFGFSPGFDLYDDQMPKSDKALEEREYPERRAEVVVDHALKWLDMQSGKPFFIWLHLYDPHEPYEPPSPFREKYRNSLYDGEVAYADQQLGRFLAAVERKSGEGKTLIVVLADHGESLGEHGEETHGVFLYDSTLRIPFIVSGSGVPAGLRVKHQARTIDALPTILDVMGGKPPRECEGSTLVPAFSGKDVPTTYSYEETLYPKMNMGWAELRGIRTPQWKYIRAPKPELYDLVQDPGEKANIIDSHPQEFRDLESRLKSMSPPGGAEKVATSPVDSKTMDQLKSLGYLAGSAKEIELNGKGADPKDRIATLKTFQVVLGPGSNKIPSARRIAMLRQALDADPTNPSLFFYLGAEYEKAGRYDDAMGVYETARSKGVLDGRLLARRGDLYLRRGKKAEAIAAYEEGARYNPADVESQTNLATAYLEMGRLPDAEQAFKRVLTVEEYALAYNGLGLIGIQRRDFESARVNFERAVALDPDLVEAQLNLGLLYKMSGNLPRSKACFEAFVAKASPKQYGQVISQVKQELASMR